MLSEKDKILELLTHNLKLMTIIENQYKTAERLCDLNEKLITDTELLAKKVFELEKQTAELRERISKLESSPN